MSSGNSKFVVYAALAGNAAIAASKFAVAGISGSSSLFSEAIHSAIDTSNQVLMLVGMARSEKAADEQHPFGYGREIYFWSFVVSILIFGVGGGLSVWLGIHQIRTPEPLESAKWAYIVLAIAFVFEGMSWIIGVREFRQRRRYSKSFWEQFKRSKDPTVFTVILEDSAALIGLLFAFAGVWSSHHFQMPMLDGIASVLIGLLLVAVAYILANEVMGLLLGEAADPAVIAQIRRVVSTDPSVEIAGDPITMQLGPHQILLNIELRFRAGLDRDGIESAIDRMEVEIRKAVPDVTRIFIEAESLKRKPEAA